MRLIQTPAGVVNSLRFGPDGLTWAENGQIVVWDVDG